MKELLRVCLFAAIYAAVYHIAGFEVAVLAALANVAAKQYVRAA